MDLLPSQIRVSRGEIMDADFPQTADLALALPHTPD